MKIRRLVVLLGVVLASTRGIAQLTDSTGQTVWTTLDIGQPPITGSSVQVPCTQVRTSCPIIGIQSSASRSATPEEVTFLFQSLAGDSEVIARVVSMSGGGLEGASGVSVRTALTPGAPAVTLWLTRSGRVNLESRQQAGGTTSRQVFTSIQQTVWLKLERRGNQVSAFHSTDGTQWTATGSVVMPPAASLFVGLVAGSQDSTSRVSAVLSDVRANPLSTLPSGWSASDIGGALAATTQYVNGMFVAVAGAGVGNTTERSRFVHTRVAGDVELVARVLAGGLTTQAEAGVMVRGSLAADAPTIALAISRTNTRVVKRRIAAGLPLLETPGGTRAAPWWFKVVRRGTLITTFESANGTAWTPVSSDVLILPASFYVGLSTAAGSSGGHAAFDRVAVQAIAGNRAPVVAVTAPLQGAIVAVGASVLLSASATDPDDRVDKVEFYVDGRLVGVDTAAPYHATWPSASAGAHVITATAVDSDGARVTSAPRTVVAASSTSGSSGSVLGNQAGSPPPPVAPVPVPQASPVTPWRLVFAPSPDHDRIVDRYRLEVYAINPRRLVYGQDLGRPAVVAGDCTVDVSRPFSALAAGRYEAVVTALDDATHLSSVGATVAFTR